jgi:arylsulfatase A-like enzyme
MAKTPRSQRAPFCLFVSLVNPHDIAYFPKGWNEAGYLLADFSSQPVSLAPNAMDPLMAKPSVQRAYKAALETVEPLDSTGMIQYGQFYAYLHSVIDAQIGKVLDTLDETGLTEETVIVRTADHGELGLSHGLREKAYSAYEEMIHVPLCISCPDMYKAPQQTSAFWSHVDLVATLCDLVGVEAPPTAGISQMPVLTNPASHVRDSVLFAFDDSFLLAGFQPAHPGAADTAIYIRRLFLYPEQ